jgi:hypothetical protein
MLNACSVILSLRSSHAEPRLQFGDFTHEFVYQSVFLVMGHSLEMRPGPQQPTCFVDQFLLFARLLFMAKDAEQLQIVSGSLATLPNRRPVVDMILNRTISEG